MVGDSLLYVVDVRQMVHTAPLFLVGVNPRPMCLAHLLVTRNMVNSSILAEMCSGLLEMERDIGVDALLSDV